ncbi:hypothetical protein FE257_005631 [Aspergillus nanangensis]|uniref:Zn(2)-C6 fungal-type domain-containing protein n=1 Tax=Aspergillus nanangensis TaxID=2582783 RepID=A0AAD4CS86_ASPNN|nr:hypothetical protein FE257_005631 [Aspergillus nanangensis]
MAGTPYSRGCRMCLSRRIKCDETRPHCDRCVSKNLKCPGYHLPVEFRHQKVLQSQNANRQSSTRSSGALIRKPNLLIPQLTLDEAVAPNLAYEAISSQTKESFYGWLMYYFPRNYSSIACRVDVNWMDFIRSLTPSNCPDALMWAIRALITFQMGSLQNSNKAICSARHMYGRGLHHLQSLLQSENALRDETLAACVLLAGYEVLDGTSVNTWVTHTRGLRSLMCARGPSAHKSGIGRTLLLSFRPFTVAEAFVLGESCFLGSPEWTSMVDEIAVEEKSRGKGSLLVQTMDHAFNEIAKCPGYYACARAIMSSETDPEPQAVDCLAGNISATKERLLTLKTTLDIGDAHTEPPAPFIGPIPPIYVNSMTELSSGGIDNGLALLDQLMTALQSDQERRRAQHQASLMDGFQSAYAQGPWHVLTGSLPAESTLPSPASTPGNALNDRPIGDGLDKFSLAMGLASISGNSDAWTPGPGITHVRPCSASGRSGDIVPQSYIVEFSDEHTTTDLFLADLTKRGVPATLSNDLSFALFKGASFKVSGHEHDARSTIQMISSMSAVKSISPVREVHLPERRVSSAGDAGFSLADHQLRHRDLDASNEVPHRMTGVDKLRKEGIIGSGIRVAVVDSGIDYKHPALGGCFGEGCLVAFGDNFADENTNDPYDDCDGHGTHVSGLIAAQSNPYNFTGVAPGVTLGHYKVKNCQRGASTDILMKAFQLAWEADADIITASIGGYSGWSEEPWGVLIQRIVAAGVPCLVAVGNDGLYGPFYASDGADGKGATGVGSVNQMLTPMLLNRATYSTKNATKEFGWSMSGKADFVNGTYQLYPLSLDATIDGDGCEPLPANTPDLSNKIVLIRRGGCGFADKAKNVADAGGKNVLFYNNGPGVDEFSFPPGELVGIGMVPASTGEEWVKLLARNTPITLHMVDKESAPTKYVVGENKQAGGFVSDFTQWGPTNELAILPTISAPGGFMLSTYPLALGGYAVESGTSMATPYFAGCIALLLEARGKITPATVNALFSATANPNVFHDGITKFDYLSSVAQQGAGLVNVYDAAHASTILNVSSIAFNDTENLVHISFSINNTGAETVEYSIGQVGSATFYTLPDDGTTIPGTFDTGEYMEMVNEHASLSFSSDSVSVEPGQASIVTITATQPQDLNETRIPIYSGYVTLNGTNGDSFSIPYLGAANAMRNVTILDTDHGENYLGSSASNKPVQAGYTFILPSPNATTAGTNTSYPSFHLRLSMGTRLLRIEVKPAHPSSNTTQVLGEPVLGSIASYPKMFLPRDATGPKDVWWDGFLENGKMAPPGTYSLLVRALKIFGDEKNPDDYDVVETPRFNLRYEGNSNIHARMFARSW